MCYSVAVMWPFDRLRQKRQQPARIARKVVVGLIIGGAIGSIVGKKLLEKHGAETEEEEETNDE